LKENMLRKMRAYCESLPSKRYTRSLRGFKKAADSREAGTDASVRLSLLSVCSYRTAFKLLVLLRRGKSMSLGAPAYLRPASQRI
jgi:hypothetical protein